MIRRPTAFAIALLIAIPLLADDNKPVLDEKAAMDAVMKHGTPGEAHKKLEPLVGDWTFTAKFTMSPDAQPLEMTGDCKRWWIMDGRFVQEDIKGEGAFPFRGLGLNGYDNNLKKYVANWVDSMTTSIISSTGEVDSTGKVFTYQREEFNPMYGQKVKTRDVITIKDNDNHQVEFYTIPPGGKEFKSGTIVCKRKK
jgi:hypothetical protein